MPDIGPISKPVNVPAKPVRQQQVRNRDSAVAKKLPEYRPDTERRKGQRRKKNSPVLLNLRTGHDRRRSAGGIDLSA
ncbi:MAG: hypothetical protein AseanaTS_31450 [Candidatus Pelagadaptatus aseana]